MKVGTSVEVQNFDWFMNEVWEPAKIIRTTKAMLPLPDGYHPVCFVADGARLLIHESRLRLAE